MFVIARAFHEAPTTPLPPVFCLRQHGLLAHLCHHSYFRRNEEIESGGEAKEALTD